MGVRTQCTRLPEFPVEVLPEWAARFVEASARALQVPSDLPGMLVLGVLAGACAKRFNVRVGQWLEPVNLYLLVALDPGNRKSAAFESAMEPIIAYERDLARRMGPEIERARAEHAVNEARITKLKTQSAKGDDEREACLREMTELAIKNQRLVLSSPRLVADDVTPERLAGLLAENRGRISVLSAEGTLFEIVAGRYQEKGTPCLEIVLKGHSGDFLRVDRQSRPTEIIRRPNITVAVAVQPDVLRGLVSKPSFRGRGLLGRFLYSVPESLVGYRNIGAPPVPIETSTRYDENVRRLLSRRETYDEDGEPQPTTIDFAPDALVAFRRVEHEIERDLRSNGRLGSIPDWGSKLAGTLVRIAGLLAAANDRATVVPSDIAKIATLREYLIAHALVAYDEMGGNVLASEARFVRQWLERTKPAEVSRREIHQGNRGRFKQVADVDRVIASLISAGTLAPILSPLRDGPGQHPSPRFRVVLEPGPASQITQNAQNWLGDRE
ncbi:MAG: DUF3987 domain-containing protein [Deltaproteobacteria bacterium]|nr:DUF3987 domain-containing protein [Deltaproteobacteria bacterium]